MSAQEFLAREPILDHRQELVGYDLRWVGPAPALNGADLLNLLINPQDKSWRLGSRIVVTDQVPAPLEAAAQIPKAAYVVELEGAMATPETAQALRNAGLACCIRTPSPAPIPHEIYSNLGYLSLDVNRLGPTVKKVSDSLRKLPARQIGRNIASAESFTAAKDARLDLYQGYWFLNPSTQTGAIIGPAYANLVTLMRLAQSNASVQ